MTHKENISCNIKNTSINNRSNSGNNNCSNSGSNNYTNSNSNCICSGNNNCNNKDNTNNVKNLHVPFKPPTSIKVPGISNNRKIIAHDSKGGKKVSATKDSLGSAESLLSRSAKLQVCIR
jgi:hypothetical protein